MCNIEAPRILKTGLRWELRDKAETSEKRDRRLGSAPPSRLPNPGSSRFEAICGILLGRDQTQIAAVDDAL
jgi:hypothetical protein